MYVEYAKNVYTYNGDDGIIEKIFEDVGIESGIVCEFGAWDGLYICVTRNLWKNRAPNFQGVLIENDPQKYADMVENTRGLDVDLFNCGVDRKTTDANSIDNILDRCKYDITPDNFAMMVIDIDSHDYYVMESIEKYFPKIINIEVSSGYKPNQDLVSDTLGCSLKSAKELGEKKGYKLICHSGNAFLLRNDLVDRLPDWDFSIENLWQSPDKLMEKERRLKDDK